MIAWSLQLYTDKFNEKMSLIEGKLTDTSDQLDILETESASLEESWESEAYEVWHKELNERVLAGKLQIEEMRSQLLNIKAMAEKLVKLEADNMGIIEEMHV